MTAIEFKNVHFSYEPEEKEVFSSESSFCLDGIDFSVQEGEFVAVLGHNGSGKSTLARLVNGLLTPTEGKINVFGLAAEEKNLFDIRKQVGIVFQNPDNQMVASIVEDDVAFGPENVGISPEEIGQRIQFALQSVGMEEYRTSTPNRLSGGQKQRIAIAGVLALKPRLMILDESTAMLDPRGRKEVMDVVLKLNKEEKMTILLITHFPEEALLADRAIVMHQGKIVMEGKPEELLKKEEQLQKYALALPRMVKISRALKRGGLKVADCLTAEELANEIEKVFITDKISRNVEAGAILQENVQSKTEKEEVIGRIVCKNLTHVYNPASPFETYALNGVDLEIPTGSFFGILGHTGSGKSTFIQHLNGLIKLPTAEKKYKEKKGQEKPNTRLRVNGYDLTNKHTDFKALRRDVGMVFQYPEYQLFAETVFEDVAFGLKNFCADWTEEKKATAVKEAIEMVGLDFERIKDASPFDLSGGQKRRVAIAGVIVTKPKILILDEPAAGLDPRGKEEIMALLHKLHTTWCKTVVIVSHDMDEIAENCEKAAIFHSGKILNVASPKALFSDKACIKKAGLDLPFTAKVIDRLEEKDIRIDCDYTAKDFVQKILNFAKINGAGMSLTEGGQGDA